MPKKHLKQSIKANFKEQIIESMDLPKEAGMNIPIITLLGNKDIAIENFEGIIEYNPNLIRLNTNCGMLSIQGENLEARSMTSEGIRIIGCIMAITFSK